MPKAYKPVLSKSDVYQGSQNTQYARDQTTGDVFLKSGINQRCIVPEQFKTAVLKVVDNTAINDENNVYTVPQGKVMLVLGMSLQISTQAATFGNAGRLKINGDGILRGYGSADTVGVAYALSQNLSSFLVLVYGDTVTVSSQDTDLRATGSIFGYEIDESEYFPAV